MRPVEEEDKLGLIEVAHFGELLEEVGEHPQEEHRVDLRLLDDARGVQDVDVALTARVAGEPIGQFKRGFAEKHVAALIFNGDERAQNGAHGLRRDVAVGRRVLLGVLAHVVEHRAQILHVDEQHLPVVGNAKDDVQHAFLHLGEPEQAREQHWPHVRDGHAHGQRRPEERATPRERRPASAQGRPQLEERARRAHALPWLPSVLLPRWERSKRRR